MQTLELTDTDVESAMHTIIDAFYDDSKHCQASHLVTENGTCLHTPVAWKVTLCGTPRVICANSAAWNERQITNPKAVCSNCKRPVSECWEVRPL